jgi:hypothetical protein
VNIFIDHFQVVTTNNYNTTGDFHTTNHSTLSLFQPVFANLSLATASNSGDFSASSAHVVTVRRIPRNWTLTPIVFKITPRHVPRRKHSASIVIEMFKVQLHSNGRGAGNIENTVLLLSRECMLRALPSNGRSLTSYCSVTDLYAIICTRVISFKPRVLYS